MIQKWNLLKYLSLLLICVLCLATNYVFANKLVISESALNKSIPNELRSKISASIVNSNSGKSVFNYKESVPRLVASNVKLITTLFALETLGADFHWHTKLLHDGKIKDDSLIGNLYLKGSGDPTLDDKAIYLILSQLKRLGIKKVEGNVVLDNSIFNTKTTYSMLEILDYDSDTILPNGLIINGNLFEITPTINKNAIKINHNLYDYEVINKLKINATKDMPCSNSYKTIKLNMESSIPKLTLSGTISSLCNKKSLAFNLLPSFTYNKMVIKKVLDDFGINLKGNYLEKKSPQSTELIYDYNSANLQQILINMNYFSNNLIAETILLTSANQESRDTFFKASKNFNSFLDKHKINNQKFKLENGAGLSRFEYFTSENLAQLLFIANKSSLAAKFEATLPTPLSEGTLNNLFSNFKNRLFIKTGTLNDVLAYSGYFYAKNGNKYILVLIANDIDQKQKTLFYNWANGLLTELDN